MHSYTIHNQSQNFSQFSTPHEIQDEIIRMYKSLPHSEQIDNSFDFSLSSQSIPSLLKMLNRISSFYQNKNALESLLIKSEAELRNQIKINNELTIDIANLKSQYLELKKSKSELNSLYQTIEKTNQNNLEELYTYKTENARLQNIIDKLKNKIKTGKAFKAVSVKYVEEEITENAKRCMNPLSKSANSLSDVKKEQRNLRYSFGCNKSENYFKENECAFLCNRHPIYEKGQH